MQQSRWTAEIFNRQGIEDFAREHENLTYLPADERHTGLHEVLQSFKADLMASRLG